MDNLNVALAAANPSSLAMRSAALANGASRSRLMAQMAGMALPSGMGRSLALAAANPSLAAMRSAALANGASRNRLMAASGIQVMPAPMGSGLTLAAPTPASASLASAAISPMSPSALSPTNGLAIARPTSQAALSAGPTSGGADASVPFPGVLAALPGTLLDPLSGLRAGLGVTQSGGKKNGKCCCCDPCSPNTPTRDAHSLAQSLTYSIPQQVQSPSDNSYYDQARRRWY